MSKFNDRTGEISTNNQGCKMQIVSYRSNKDVDILFIDNNITIYNQPYSVFNSGEIKNPMFPSVYNRGYMGIGKYECRINGIMTPQYKRWESMMHRCYDERYLAKQPTYIDCEVGEYFLNYQNFAKWYDENLWTNDVLLVPDKDILIKGNKIYEPDKCFLVDKTINNLFLKRVINKGSLPIGVHYDKERNKFIATCHGADKKTKFLGRFDNPIDAFVVYKKYKESVIKEVANIYKTKYENFPKKLYETMINYKIEIDD